MDPTQEEFIVKCPTWARKLGIPSLKFWYITESLFHLPWAMRHDQLQEMVFNTQILDDEKDILIKVLKYWDDMAGTMP